MFWSKKYLTIYFLSILDSSVVVSATNFYFESLQYYLVDHLKNEAFILVFDIKLGQKSNLVKSGGTYSKYNNVLYKIEQFTYSYLINFDNLWEHLNS